MKVNTPNSPLLIDNVNGVATLTLNRPDHFNALSEQLLAQLQQRLDLLAGDDDLRCVVLAGAGNAFCAGHDLKEMRANPDRDYYVKLFAACGSADPQREGQKSV
jgi:enoyl-CoA hydratase/carnithine racemase